MGIVRSNHGLEKKQNHSCLFGDSVEHSMICGLDQFFRSLPCISNTSRSSECEMGCILAWINRNRNEDAMSPTLKMKVNRYFSDRHELSPSSFISPCMGHTLHYVSCSVFFFLCRLGKVNVQYHELWLLSTPHLGNQTTQFFHLLRIASSFIVDLRMESMQTHFLISYVPHSGWSPRNQSSVK